jgi:hypothetical protein
VAAELIHTGAFTKEEAWIAARAFASDRGMDETAAAIALARATADLPEGVSWWLPERKAHLLEGKPSTTYRILGEQLSEPPDVVIDSWPDPDDVSSVRIQPGMSPGDVFVVGDTEGRRARATVVERDGTIGVLVERPTSDHPLEQLHTAALIEAAMLLARG